MSMNGIDISAWQKGINIAGLTTTQFVIVKATEGTNYTSETFTAQMDAAIKAGKKVGCYHYATGVNAEKEAAHFLEVAKPYIGKAVLALDWESGGNSAVYKTSYAKTWLDYVKAKSGITPIIYMQESLAAGLDWSAVAKSYKLWGAQYPNYNTTDYKTKPWTSGGWGAWGELPTIFQYTSSGRITGYSGNLDLDLFYGSALDWDKMAGTVALVEEGWKQNSTGWWYQNADGSYPHDAWKKVDDKWYWFDGDGYIVTNQWQWYKNQMYYLGSDGAMVTSKNVKINADGELVPV